MPTGTQAATPGGKPTPDATGLWRRLGPGQVFSILGALLLLFFAGDVLLLLFAGILLAVALDGLACTLAKRTGMSRGWGLVAVVALVLVLAAGGAVAAAPQLAEQFDLLWRQLAETVRRLPDELGRYSWFQDLVGGGQQGGGDENGGMDGQTAGQIAGQVASATLVVVNALASLVLVVVIGLFLAVNPGLYRGGLLRLVPAPHRPKAKETLDAIGYGLRWWLLGQLVSMLVLGVLTAVILLVLGVPLWLPLAVLTGILTFIPFIGPVLAGIPVVLISLSQGLDTALYALGLFLVLQMFEGNWLTPMVQQRAVQLPPALLLGTQVLMGTLFGIAGLVLAAPLAAAGLVAVNLLYIEGMLGERRATPR